MSRDREKRARTSSGRGGGRHVEVLRSAAEKEVANAPSDQIRFESGLVESAENLPDVPRDPVAGDAELGGGHRVADVIFNGSALQCTPGRNELGLSDSNRGQRRKRPGEVDWTPAFTSRTIS